MSTDTKSTWLLREREGTRKRGRERGGQKDKVERISFFFFLHFCFGQASLLSYFMTVFRPDTQTSSGKYICEIFNKAKELHFT